jgi:hypothetical protein
MAVQTIGTCPGCGSWASLRGGLCPTCAASADLVVAGLTRAAHGRVLTVPIGLLSSGLPIQARVLASAGFSAARIAELLAADEADVRRVLG